MPPPESLVIDGRAKIPTTLRKLPANAASIAARRSPNWEPGKRSILIGTAAGAATPQLQFGQPAGRTPSRATYILYRRGARRSLPTQTAVTISFSQRTSAEASGTSFTVSIEPLATLRFKRTEKSRNSNGPLVPPRRTRSPNTSTRRTGKDTDLWVTDPAEPKSDRLHDKTRRRRLEPVDWSPDDKKILLVEELSHQ